MTTPALLVLEDGRTFRGEAYGAVGETFGEAVFSTGMTGYQETLTDPSYHRQVVVMTAPQIGNTGVNDEDPESSRIWVSGYVVREPSRVSSSWRAKRSLAEELAAQGVVGISGIDTRALTRHLRERGAMRVGIFSGTIPDDALDRVKASPQMLGADLCGEVSTSEPYVVKPLGDKRFTVAALDLGIKANTPRMMAERGIEVHVLPAGSSAQDVLAVAPDGVFFSNGPRDRATTTRYGEATVSHVCLNDDVVEGLELRRDGQLVAFSVQYHPEAAAGPHDAAYLFDRFCDLMGSAGA
jgi:carbamoyl-phosphate synthase small subunit